MISQKKILFSIITGVIFGQIAFAQNNTVLSDLIQEALDNNPQIKVLEKEWQSKRAIILSEKTLPQPEVSFTHFGESIQTRTGPQKRKYGIRQPIPFPTKLSTKGKIAKKAAEIAYAQYILGVRGIIEQLKTYFYDYYFVHYSINILDEEKMILESMRKIIQRKYETLEVSQQDLVKADLEIAKIEDKILNLKNQENLLGAQINRVLNKSQAERLNISSDYRLLPQEVNLKKETLLEKALKESPHILIEQLGLERQAYKLSLAKQGFLPDFTVMADYIEIGEGETTSPDDGKDAWMVGVGLRIPLWFWKIKSEIKSEKLQTEAQEYKLVEKEDYLSFKVEDLYFKLKTEEQLIDLYDNVILPQAEQNFSVSRIGYENNKIDFLNWLDAERNLISIKIAKLKQAVDYKKTLAQIEYIVGEDLE
jgi:outer membrane protein TolC